MIPLVRVQLPQPILLYIKGAKIRESCEIHKYERYSVNKPVTEKDYIKNAITIAKRDEYDQLIVIDKNGDYSIRRKYPKCIHEWLEERITAEIIVFWQNGMLRTIVTKDVKEMISYEDIRRM